MMLRDPVAWFYCNVRFGKEISKIIPGSFIKLGVWGGTIILQLQDNIGAVFHINLSETEDPPKVNFCL